MALLGGYFGNMFFPCVEADGVFSALRQKNSDLHKKTLPFLEQMRYNRKVIMESCPHLAVCDAERRRRAGEKQEKVQEKRRHCVAGAAAFDRHFER